MASFGHVAVGLLTGRLHGGGGTAGRRRPSWGTLALFAGLAALPDADVFGVALGAADRSLAGHRGASHSLFTAVVVGMACALLAKRLGWPPLRTAIAATLAVASHGLLDMCSANGRPIPFLWPLTCARWFAPLRVLPDAPRGLALLSHRGAVDVGLEFLLFLPVTLFALWPERARRPPRLTVLDGAGGGALPNDAAVAPAGDREPPLRSSG
jgi:inner membrane protein